jgi:adenine-specific DNA-methyltransferase
MKVFVGGSKTITALTDESLSVIDTFCSIGAEFLIGDCYGADKLVQTYLAEHEYRNVTVYTSGDKTRNNVGGFKEKHISAVGFSGFEFYRQKDIAMAVDADCALMLWDGKTQGTRQNITDLNSFGKSVRIIKYSCIVNMEG